MASYNWFSTRIFLLLNFLVYGQPLTVSLTVHPFGSLLLLKLFVKGFSLVEYLHQLFIDFVAVELLQNILLVLKLILRLFGLFSSLLLLDEGESILGWLVLSLFDSLLQIVLAVTLCTF